MIPLSQLLPTTLAMFPIPSFSLLRPSISLPRLFCWEEDGLLAERTLNAVCPQGPFSLRLLTVAAIVLSLTAFSGIF